MAPGVVIQSTVEAFQKQYGTLARASEAYLDGRMTTEQAASFERVVDAGFVFAVSMTRLLREVVDLLRRNED